MHHIRRSLFQLISLCLGAGECCKLALSLGFGWECAHSGMDGDVLEFFLFENLNCKY